MDETSMWRLEVGGATYSVIARDPEAAIQLVRAYEDEAGCDPWDHPPSVKAYQEAGARKQVVNADELPDSPPLYLWDEHVRDPSPRVVSCSEW